MNTPILPQNIPVYAMISCDSCWKLHKPNEVVYFNITVDELPGPIGHRFTICHECARNPINLAIPASFVADTNKFFCQKRLDRTEIKLGPL